MSATDLTLAARPPYPWLPMPRRATLRWPDGSPLALVVIVAIEHFELMPRVEATPPPTATYTSPYPAVFDGGDVLLHEYGSRVGFFRLIETLEQLGVKPTIAMDALTALRSPNVVELCLDRSWEIVARGWAGSDMITSSMSEREERIYIRRTLDTLESRLGRETEGWFGVEYGETFRTPQLLHEAGIQFVCDWPADEQPFWFSSPADLVGLPVGGELDDVLQHRARFVSMEAWGKLLIETARRLRADGMQNARMMGVVVNSWLSGQPFRLGYVERALKIVLDEGSVWQATAGDVVRAFRHSQEVAK